MPRLAPIDKSSDLKPRRFMLAGGKQTMRLQTGVTFDKIDPTTNQRLPGTSSAIQWDGPVLMTNRADWIEAIEKSYAFQDGQILDLDVMDEKRKEAEENALVAKLTENPEYAAKLKSKLDELLASKSEDKGDTQKSGASSFGKGSRSK